MNPFDLISSVSHTKVDILEDEKDYNSWLVNRGLSQFPDTVMYANEMNINWNLDARLQYDFYMNTIRARKRFSKWAKAEKTEDVDLIKRHYGYSDEKARQALRILTPQDLESIRQTRSLGGRK